MGQILHASTVTLAGRGLMIQGRAGSGKSTLALQLMAYGATLISDDRTEVFQKDGTLRARAPTAIAGRIEARGIGILAAQMNAEVALVAVVDLDRNETDRLPEKRSTSIEGVTLPLLYRPAGVHFAPGLLQYLKAGRAD